MSNPDWNKILEDLKDAVVGTVKSEVNDFLDQFPDAKSFLEDRAKRIVQLGIEYLKGSETERKKTELQIQVVQQSIRNQLSAIAVTAEAKAKETFAKVLQTALGVIAKAIPALASLI